MEIKELIKNIETWGIERELDKKGTVEGQSIKTSEEMAELIIGISKENIETIKDSIGDIYVTLIIGNMISFKVDMNGINHSNENKLEKIPKDYLHYDKSKQIRLIADKIDIVTRKHYKKDIIEGTQYLLLRIADMYQLDFKECVESAYNEIANRKGKMIGGTFVKEEDLENCWINRKT